jgi:Spy/CpxP family protein refolding chaperone
MHDVTSKSSLTDLSLKCSARQIEQMRRLAAIFLEMFQRLTPEQRRLFEANSLAYADPVSIRSAA